MAARGAARAALAAICSDLAGLMTLPALAARLHRGCGTVAYSVAAPAWCLAGAPTLARGQRADRAGAHVAFASGPALGGVLVGWVGARPLSAFAPRLSVIAGCCCRASMSRPRPRRRHPLLDIKEGAAFVLHHPLLRPVFITQFIFNTASFLLLAVFVPYAVRHLGFPPPASAPRSRCTASAWWSARCWRRG
jgi:hypothetical protein